ncbi:MAG: bifunctional folylpolyglutamate synthase/dihydrofolate synthase [Lachnospiraceae bacterium]|nr:bifunctional folylpolyglutamate synthase/dihydrofolate synthase [Lachnospiraceae bacterium]
MVREEIRTYEDAVEYLLNIPRFTKKKSMEDTKAFLKRLGSPDKGFKIIHVAGTNGKGSVCAYLRYMLEEAGYGVCSFTSPHLVDVRERFLIRGEMVSKEAFFQAFLAIYDAIPWELLTADVFNEEGKLPEGFYHPTFFEYLFFMAMLLFRDAKPDYVILETGLGGRLDATNSVSHKEAAVITRISLDHMEYLGDTTEKIAGEKAGIIAEDAPVIYLDDEEKISAVFENQAKNMGAKPCPVSKNDFALLKFQNKIIDFSLHTRYYKCIGVTLHTAALYQMENAALAVRTIEELDQGHNIKAEQIQNGLAKAFWPGRMEEVLPNVFVDGAHNEDGVRAFLESVRADGWQGRRSLVFSAVKDKQYEKMLGEILSSGLFAELYLVPIHTGRATKVEVLENLARELTVGDVSIAAFDDVKHALEELLQRQEKDQRIYVAGSLYLVGEVKADLGVIK